MTSDQVLVDMRKGRMVWEVAFIAAKNPGNGDVAEWLDALPKDKKIVFKDVMSPHLAAMLERRGFEPTGWIDHIQSEVLIGMIKRKGLALTDDAKIVGRPQHWVRKKTLDIGLTL